MRSKAHWGYPDEFMEACRAELTYDSGYLAVHEVYVVEVGDHVAGFCSLERLDDERVELGGLFVEPALIGTGLGRALMQRALVAARAAGARSMVIHGDPHAAAFYEAAGAVDVGRVASNSIPGRFLPLYEIDLREER
jgi:GNAT superfamily N-acetyltransferase